MKDGGGGVEDFLRGKKVIFGKDMNMGQTC